MYKLKQTGKGLSLEDLILGLTGIVATVISLLDLLGWLNFSTDTLIQVIVAGLGLFMTAFVLQSNKQKKERLELLKEISSSLKGKSETISFDSSNEQLEYMSKMLYSANNYVDHMSLGTTARWTNAASEFESAYRKVIRNDKIKVRYIANLTDEGRRTRAEELVSNPPEINQYFVRSVDPEQTTTVPPLSFMIIDDQEIILAIPAGFGNRDSLIAIQNRSITQAFRKYFDLVWAQAETYNNI